MEQYGSGHFMARLIYAVYALPVLAILVISGSLFRFRRFVLPVKMLMLVIAGIAFFMILQFHQSPEYNIWMRYGVIVSALCSLLLVMREVVSRLQRGSLRV